MSLPLVILHPATPRSARIASRVVGMRTIGYLAVVALAASCGKKTGEDKPAPAPSGSASSVGSAGSAGSAELAKPAASTAVPVTSKSPDAIKAFEAGRDLTDSERGPEAVALFKKAIELDPDFAQAHAYLGIVTQGPPGMAELDKAKALAAKLPDAERLVIEGAHASRSGDHAAMIAAYTKLAELVPGDWRVLVALGWEANDTGDPAKAIEWFGKALKVNPELAFAQDGLAYGHAGLREWDAAIAAAKKQVELLPKQPNPQDTLGEILLMAGKFEDAEKAFQAALELEPKYNIAWQGVALARAYRGDWKGAYEANEKQNAGTVDTYDSVGVIIDGAWLVYAASELQPALARLDVVDADAEAKTTPAYAFAALARATLLQLEDKYADAAKWFETGRTRGEGLPGSTKRLVARDHAIGLLRNGALSGKAAADADKLLATLDQDAKAAGDPTSKSYAAWGHGLAAWAKTGAKDAVAELSKCRLQLVACRFDLATAQRKAGDAAGADATEQQIRQSPQREASAVFYVTELAKK